MIEESIDNLHARLLDAISKQDNIRGILESTTYNHALLPILNYYIKDIKPSSEEIEFTEYIIEHYEMIEN